MSGLTFDVTLATAGYKLKHKQLSLGIFNAKNLKGSDYDKPVKAIGGGVVANATTKSDYKSDGKTKTTADSFASVYEKTPFKLYLSRIFASRGDILVECWYGDKSVVSQKKAANSLLALARQAYVKMSRAMANDINRVVQKGFDGFAIGTGQTLKSMDSKIE